MTDGVGDVEAALGPVARVFENAGVRFYVGGSVASSFHGAMRTTMDVDVVADLKEEHISSLVTGLLDGYYVSEPAVRDAVRHRRCFNLIHLKTSFKIDVFIHRRRPFDESVFRRTVIGNLGNALNVPIASPEDSIIAKLEWYRLGGESSERQWNDVVTLVQLLGKAIDHEYLREAAKEVGVSDLLQRLLAEPKR